MFYHPLIPIVQVDPNNPPFVPNIIPPNNIGFNLNLIVPMIAAEVINQAGNIAATNSARMFCYNVLSQNNWRNSSFVEFIQLVVDLMNYNHKKNNFIYPEQAIKESVYNLLTWYTSELVVNNEQLKSIINPEQLNLAFNNVQQLHALKRELMAFGSVPQNFNPMNQMGMMGGNAHAPMPMGNMSLGNTMQQPYQQRPGNYLNNAYQQNIPQVIERNYYNKSSDNIRQPSQQNNNEPIDLSFDRFDTRPVNIKPPPVVMEQPSVSLVTPVIKDNRTTPTIGEGRDMNREAHTVGLIGTYAPSPLRFEQLDKATKALSNESPLNNNNDNFILYGNVLYEPNLDTAISSVQITQFEQQNKQADINIFRSFCATSNPIMSNYDLSPYMALIRRATSLTDLNEKLTNLVSSLSKKGTASNIRYTDSVISFLSRIDIRLTKLVNSFLFNELDLPISIESFSSDIANLRTVLFSTYGNNYSNALNILESIVMSSIDIVDSEHARLIVIAKESLEIPDGVFIAIIPTTYSITMTFMNDNELKYDQTQRKMNIEKESSPSLYRIADSLGLHKKKMDINTTHDLLITSDGERYYLHKNLVKPGQYIISKA